MKRWLEQQPEAVRQQIENTFIQLSNLEIVRGSEHKTAGLEDPESQLNVSFYDLYALATGQNTKPLAQINRALLANPVLNRNLQSLIRQHALATSPKVAAASSGVLHERQGEGFRLLLKSSKADPAQVYIQIQLTREYKHNPQVIIVRGTDGEMVCFNLPDPDDQFYQWLHSTDSGLVRALRDRETELYLC